MSRFRGISTLASGTILAQLITIVATPLLTRLYSPESFAALALVVSTANTLAVFAHGRLTVAIAASENEEVAQEIFVAGKRLVWITCGLSFILLVCANFLGIAKSHTISIALTACVLGGITATLDLYAFFRNASKAYRISAAASVIRAVSTVILQAMAAILGAVGQVVGAIGGAAVSMMYSRWAIYRHQVSIPKSPPMTTKWMLEKILQHRNYVFYSAPQALVSALGHNLPPIIFAATASPNFVGHYWLAFRLLIAPITILGGSYRQASIPAFKVGARRILWVLIRDTGLLALMVAAMAGGLALSGGYAFALAFGERWREAGDIAGILVIGYGADLIKVPAVCLLQARRMEKLLLGVEIFSVIFKLTTLIVCLRYMDPFQSLGAFSVASALGALSLLVIGLILARRSTSRT